MAGGVGPVLVGGDHRSGTTVLSVILDSHPDVVMGPEIDFLEPVDLGPHVLECCALLTGGDPRVAGQGVQTADPAWQPGVQFVRQCHRFGVELDDLRALVQSVRRRRGSDLVTLEDRCALLEAIGDHRRRSTGKPMWGIKIQRLITRADELARVWPQARFVHIVRDGRDVAASHLLGGQDWAYSNAAEAGLGWSRIVDRVAVLAGAHALHELTYEALTSNPRQTLEPLLEFLGLGWDDALLSHAEHPHALFDNPHDHPSAEAARQPVNAGAVGRHRQLTAEQVAVVEATAGPALRRLGYAPPAAEPDARDERRRQVDAALAPYRAEIDRLDDGIVAALGERFDVIRRVAAFKAEVGIEVMQHDRVDDVKRRCHALAARHGVDAEVIEAVYTILIDASCAIEAAAQAPAG